MKVLGVRFGIGNPKHDGEGRSVTVEYEKVRCVRGVDFFLSGMKRTRQGEGGGTRAGGER